MGNLIEWVGVVGFDGKVCGSKCREWSVKVHEKLPSLDGNGGEHRILSRFQEAVCKDGRAVVRNSEGER